MAACPLVPASSCRKSLASVPESDKHERRVHRSSAGERRLTLPAELQETDPPPSIPASLRRKLDGGKTKESCRRNCIRAAVKEELKDGPTCIPTLQVPTSRPQKAVVLSMEEPSKLISTSGAIQDKDKIWKELIDFDTAIRMKKNDRTYKHGKGIVGEEAGDASMHSSRLTADSSFR